MTITLFLTKPSKELPVSNVTNVLAKLSNDIVIEINLELRSSLLLWGGEENAEFRTVMSQV